VKESPAPENRPPSSRGAAEAPPAGAPREFYAARLGERERDLALWSRREGAISYSRLAVVVAGLVAAWLSVQANVFSPWWLVAPAVLFLLLLQVHERVLRSRDRARSAVDFHRRGIERLDDCWAGRGDAGERYIEQSREGRVEHLYASDLDLFGRGSLFELLAVTRTRSGSDTLAGWLLRPAAPAEVRERQAAVADLRGRLELREELFALGEEVHASVDQPGESVAGAALRDWAAAPEQLGAFRPLRWLLPFVALANVAAAAGWAFWGLGPRPLLVLGLVETVGFLFLRGRILESVRGIDRAARDLAVLAGLLDRFEAERFEAPWLARRGEALRRGEQGTAHEEPPGERVRGLQRLVDLLDSRRNPLFAPLGALVLWTTQLAFAIEAWRRRHGRDVSHWMETLGELEAAAALGTYAFDHPGDPFPEIVEAAPGSAAPVLAGSALGHPLLPEAACVRNDVELGGENGAPRALIVSGSNMSGKSTFLRTCGVNVVLAQAGAPVRAASLRLSPLAVGASIRVVDSLQEGESKFYAEITRLRRILDLTRDELPVLFLLDEILHGTNSHDRRIGAEAVIRALLDRGAIGLVTTHDLALARIAEEPASHLSNVHFQDTLEDGRVRFDYRLREGVVQRSNALALMREVGLEV
jgi:hypothetical protein